jgi:PTH1 family peptidyl-tRNA hydrolase
MFFAKRPAVDYIVIGLGNPGKKYRQTRHNAGFQMLDAFAEKHDIRVIRSRFSALTGIGTAAGNRLLLVKPSTFMNLSGSTAASAAGYYRLPPERVAVLCDDVSLAPGVIRIRASGSAGGHNGLQSVIDMLGSNAFPRIRIGVGAKPRPEYDLADWVLASPSSADQKLIEGRAGDVCDALELIITGRLDQAQSRYNG